jgi:membrane protease YdiL (CAAX protease family)
LTRQGGDPPSGATGDGPQGADDDWTILSVPVDAPPDPIATEPGSLVPAWMGVAVDRPPDQPKPPAPGPPGGRIFSLEDRPAPALYLVAWLLSVGGAAMLLVTTQAAPSTGRTIAVLAAAAALGLGLSVAAGYQVIARRDRAPRWYRGPSPLLAFGVVLVVSAIAAGLLAGTGAIDVERPIGFLLGLALVAATYVAVVWLFAVRTGALTWAEMGWPTIGPDRLRRSLRAVGIAVLVIVPTTFGVLVLGGLVGLALGVEAPSVVPPAATSGEALAVALAAAVVAPVGEELFFRGFALTAWARDLPERSALIRSAAFFAIVHIANIQATTFREGASQAVLQLVVIVPLGLVLGWLFLRLGIVAAIAGHVTYNSLLLGLLLLGTGRTAG